MTDGFAHQLRLDQLRDGERLDLSADRFAQSVHIAIDGYRPGEHWFHLAPGRVRSIRLMPLADTDPAALPSGEISQLGSNRIVRL